MILPMPKHMKQSIENVTPQLIDKSTEIKKKIDPEVQAVIDELPGFFLNPTLETQEDLSFLRAIAAPELPPFQSDLATMQVKTIESNQTKVKVYIYQPSEQSTQSAPAVLWIHGGGYAVGTARDDQTILSIIEAIQGPVISVEYSLTPENPAPTALKECYAALVWMSENADLLNIDPNKIAIAGSSAGGGLAAGLALYNRDQKGPSIACQILWQPMLDNLHNLPSACVLGYPIWNRRISVKAWEMYLGGTPGQEASPYAAAMRATDLSCLPPAFIAVGELDLFQDECAVYTERLKEAGVPVEFKIYPGAVHGTEKIAAGTRLSKQITRDRQKALKNYLE